jgi:hypothetical protein
MKRAEKIIQVGGQGAKWQVEKLEDQNDKWKS